MNRMFLAGLFLALAGTCMAARGFVKRDYYGMSVGVLLWLAGIVLPF